MGDQPPLPHADARERAEHAAAAVEHDEYLEQVRAAARTLAAPETQADDIRAAVAVLEEHATVNAVAPVESRNRGASAAKKVVRKAVFFTTHHLASQISSLGWSTVTLGNAAADRIEALEHEVADLRARIVALEEQGRRDG